MLFSVGYLPVTQPALDISNLSFAYPGRPATLHNITLQIAPTERVGLIGPNGAGKTTLFMLVCGVLTPKSGEILSFGKAVKPGQFHPDVNMVFQNSNDQLFSPTVWDDVAFGPQNLGLSPAEVKARVDHVLNLTGVTELADRPPHHLSGGEKRMVSIAGVLAMNPRLVVYDEPSANLDLRARRRLLEFLKAAEHAMLVSSHDLEFVLELCDRVILMDEGGIITQGVPAEVMRDQALMEAHGLEKPHSLIPHPHHVV
ncbi:MAG: ABC transporter ATP-binding protein [Okeania sp. SIO3B3]|nr:ABC transporter ATP-binding protein [Okeania sp. SIO3B3]